MGWNRLHSVEFYDDKGNISTANPSQGAPESLVFIKNIVKTTAHLFRANSLADSPPGKTHERV